MELYQQQIIETILVVVIYITVRKVSSMIVNRTLISRNLIQSRGQIIKKVLNVTLIIISLILLSLIWGVKRSELAVFTGSILTIIGVAFFAQWSLLSNMTSSIILFFSHPVRINDTILILEAKDYAIEGKVTDIGVFFTTLETKEGEELTLPNNMFIQKSILKIMKKEGDDESVELQS